MAEKLFYSMGEVAEMFDVNSSLLRYWESQFKMLSPQRNTKGDRIYNADDIKIIKQIYHLVRERGMTLNGAKKLAKSAGKNHAVDRDVKLLECLQRIRSSLVEVREELREDGEEVVSFSVAYTPVVVGALGGADDSGNS